MVTQEARNGLCTAPSEALSDAHAYSNKITFNILQTTVKDKEQRQKCVFNTIGCTNESTFI